MNTKLKIHTKQIREKWFCHTTTNYDYSFEGKTAEDAQEKMRIKLKEWGVPLSDVDFSEPVFYKQKPTQNPGIGYTAIRVDNLR